MPFGLRLTSRMTSREQLQDTLCKRLFWHTAERDDGKVADYLFHHHEMDVVYAMDEAALFDSFFNYLQDIEAFPFLERKRSINPILADPTNYEILAGPAS